MLFDLIWIIFEQNPITLEKSVPEICSLGDSFEITLTVKNKSIFIWNLYLIDEAIPIPAIDHFDIRFTLFPASVKSFKNALYPSKRGEFQYKNSYIYLSSYIGFFSRRLKFTTDKKLKVIPGLSEVKKYSLINKANNLEINKSIASKRLTHSYEFEQIKQYVAGDDIRNINWKSTSKHVSIMTNHYTEEKSQQVYCIIDKSKNMGLSYKGLSLLDYAIKSSVSLLKIAVDKGDQIGLITFTNKIETLIKASAQNLQLKRIVNHLFKEEYLFNESDYQKLYFGISKIIPNRSLILFYTNFENRNSLKRNLPVLLALSKKHLLVLILFEDPELEEYAYKSNSKDKAVITTLSRKYHIEKYKMASELEKNGIRCILTTPEKLNGKTISTYLELKYKHLI